MRQKFPHHASFESKFPPSIVTQHQRAVPVNTLVVVVMQVSHCPGDTSYQLGGGAKQGALAKIQSGANCRRPTRYNENGGALLDPLWHPTKNHTSKINKSNIIPRDTQTKDTSLWL